jgi:hypothetical protein
MKGYPKTIATLHDLEVARAAEPELAKQYLRALLDERMVWVQTEMKDLEDDTHKIVVEEDMDGNETRQQFALVEDQNCKLFRLGLSVADAEVML